jgi:Na+/melibiose symporter-like transporter
MKGFKNFWILSLILIGLLLFFFFYKRTNEGFRGPIKVQAKGAVRVRGGRSEWSEDHSWWLTTIKNRALVMLYFFLLFYYEEFKNFLDY